MFRIWSLAVDGDSKIFDSVFFCYHKIFAFQDIE